MKFSWIGLFSLTLVFGQYSEEWQINQDQYEKGILYFDINEDGFSDITKSFWNSITVFDGANDYAIIWSIYDETSENIAIWELYDFNGDGEKMAILTGSNFYNSVDFHLLGYSIFGASPEWVSSSYEGSLSFLSAAELDEDVGKELIFGINRFDDVDSSYYFSIKILDGITGNEEWSSQEQPGYLSGPYVGDLDGDDKNEFMLNVYDYKDENYYMSVWSHSGGIQAISSNSIPDEFTVHPNYPNPFNPNTILPIELQNDAQLSITVLNMQGVEVQNIVNGQFSSGKYQFSWNGKSRNGTFQSSGVYFFNIIIDGTTIQRPMVFMK